MANQFNAKTDPNIQGVINAITTAVGNNLAMDFSNSPGFTIRLTCEADGRTLTLTANPLTQGPNNPFGPPDSVPGSPQVVETHLQRTTKFQIDAALLVS